MGSHLNISCTARHRVGYLVLCCLGLALILFSKVLFNSKGTIKKNFISPPRGLEYLTFGFQEVVADSLWIRAIQDLDYCDQPLSKQQCLGQSWLYQMLDVTTSLSPHFRMPYVSGALALTVLITDVDGATKLFDKGVKAFPKDWPLLYRAAYHYLYEVKDKKRAADLLIQASQNGGPEWLPSLANRLYVDSDNVDLAEALLRDMVQQQADSAMIKRMQQKIQSIKKNTKSR